MRKACTIAASGRTATRRVDSTAAVDYGGGVTYRCRYCQRDVPSDDGACDDVEEAVGPICDDCASHVRWLLLATDSGRTAQAVWVVGETPAHYRIRSMGRPVRLPRRRYLIGDRSALVPKYAVRLHRPEKAEIV